jgi:RNase adapter protein RapZ
MTPPSPPAVPHLELAVITGMSGAGRSTAAKCLEDLGWYVVDNLPPSLISSVADLAARGHGGVDRIAVVVDVRSWAFSTDLDDALHALRDSGRPVRVVFLEASDAVLVRRFDGVRRPHPLQGDGRLVDGISRERDLLRELRGNADIVIDTAVLNVHELRAKIAAAFESNNSGTLHLAMLSFGYKYGLPLDADLVIDCRLLPNPHWVSELRPLTGLDPAVRDYVLSQPGAEEFVAAAAGLLRRYREGYVAEGKHYATIAVGCTGGRHRSVAIVEELARRIQDDGVDIALSHRDMEHQ